MAGHRELIAWKKSMALVTQIRDLDYLAPDRATALLKQSAEVGRVLTGLRDWSEKERSKREPLAASYQPLV